MPMRIDYPTTWHEVNEALWRKSFDDQAQKWRTYTAFRGLSEDYSSPAPHRKPNIFTKVQRLGEERGSVPRPSGSLEWKERRIIDIFRMYERLALRSGTTDWDVMLLGQHHGMPTRLKHEKDGVVWCVRRLETNTVLPDDLKTALESTRTGLFSLEGLARAYPTLEEFDKLSPDSLLFFEPPSVSPRIVSQYAFFSVMPGVRTHILPWLEAHKEFCWKVIIPAKLKKEIRERLMVMNVSERTIYPGLDGTCRWLEAWFR